MPEGRQDPPYAERILCIRRIEICACRCFRFSLPPTFVNTPDATIPESPYPTRYTSLSVLAAQTRMHVLRLPEVLLGTYITERVKTGDRPADRKRISPALRDRGGYGKRRISVLEPPLKDISGYPPLMTHYLRIREYRIKT